MGAYSLFYSNNNNDNETVIVVLIIRTMMILQPEFLLFLLLENKHGYVHNVSPLKRSTKSKNEWFDFNLQVSPAKVRRIVGFDQTKHQRIEHFQETKSPILLKNLVIPENEDNDWLFTQQSYVSPCANSDVQFSYVEQVKSEASASTSQEGCDVSL